MAETGTEMDSVLREWAPMSELLNKIPTKAQHGIFNQQLSLTCVDVLPEYVALGTNIGLVYWYDRAKKDLQRLRCENVNAGITSIKIVSTVDYMVACGNADGQVSIFQIPKTHPDSIPENLKPKTKQVERYTVSELHKSAISSLEWAKNGMKLFSGDKNGVVVQTEIDFYMDLLNNECFEVPLINPISGHAKKLKPIKEATFGILLPFGDNLLVTHSSEIIYILDPTNLLVIATISHLRRIVSVAAYKDEIFILEGERSLIRVSFKPEPILSSSQTSTIPLASTFLPIANSIKDLTSKLQSTNIISALPPLFENSWHADCNVHTDTTSVISAEEALELPLIKKLPYSVPLKILEPRILDHDPEVKCGQECKDARHEIQAQMDVFNKISMQEYDDHILYKHHRKKRHRNGDSDMTTSVTSVSSTSSDERDSHINRPCVLDVSTIGPILPDLRSPESIMKDIENKEKILAGLLNLDKVKFSSFENDVQESNGMLIETPEKSITNSQSESDRLDSLDKNQYLCDYATNVLDSPLKFKTDKYTFNQATDVKSDFGNDTHSYGPPSGSSIPNTTEPPACLVVPNMWKLQEIQINSDLNETSDNSLCDWEII